MWSTGLVLIGQQESTSFLVAETHSTDFIPHGWLAGVSKLLHTKVLYDISYNSLFVDAWYIHCSRPVHWNYSYKCMRCQEWFPTAGKLLNRGHIDASIYRLSSSMSKQTGRPLVWWHWRSPFQRGLLYCARPHWGPLSEVYYIVHIHTLGAFIRGLLCCARPHSGGLYQVSLPHLQ